MINRHVLKVLKIARAVLRTFRTGAKCTSKGRFPILHIIPDEDTRQDYQNLKPAAHGEERAEQTASRGGLLSHFLTVCGELLVQNWPREAVRKKSNMFDIFCLARQIPHCVRPS